MTTDKDDYPAQEQAHKGETMDTLFTRRPLIEKYDRGEQRIYRFANGYGASVVRHEFSYGGKQGRWELAVTKWDGDHEGADWSLTYETPVTDDVIGWLDEAKVEETLDAIEALPRA